MVLLYFTDVCVQNDLYEFVKSSLLFELGFYILNNSNGNETRSAEVMCRTDILRLFTETEHNV